MPRNKPPKLTKPMSARDYIWNDNEFKGNGILKCGICGDPFTADHHVKGYPCPYATDKITVDSSRRRKPSELR